MLGRMQDSLVAMVGEVRGGADAIASASKQIASGNAEQVNVAVSQMDSMTQQNAALVEQAAAAAASLEDQAQRLTALVATFRLA